MPSKQSSVSVTGISGLDAVLRGGLPLGHTTIVLGGPGSGKTVLAMQYLVNGALDFDEPGLMISFEESPRALSKNFPPFACRDAGVLGDGVQLIDARLPDEAIEAGTFDVGGLIAVASSIIAKRGIKRIALDGIDALFTLSSDQISRRREVLRVVSWLAQLDLTALLTIKAHDGHAALSGSYDLAEYAADGVISLNTTMVGELARRTLAVLKMRGASYYSGAQPYMISIAGMRVLHALTNTEWTVGNSDVRLSTGVERLDRMLSGGYRTGTITLISGLPGTSKTTLGAAFLYAGFRAGERTLFIGFDEPAGQMLTDVHSVGIDLDRAVAEGSLVVASYTAGGLIADEHFLAIESLIDQHHPKRIVIDPISALEKAGGVAISDAVTERIAQMAKSRGITAVFTAMATTMVTTAETTVTQVSTICDTWIHLSFANHGGERNRTLTIVKSRGTAHSNQMRELKLSSDGIDLADVYSSGGDVLVGTARAERERQELAQRLAASDQFTRDLAELDRAAAALMREAADAERSLDELRQRRAEIYKRAAQAGLARDQESEMIHMRRSGDDPG